MAGNGEDYDKRAVRRLLGALLRRWLKDIRATEFADQDIQQLADWLDLSCDAAREKALELSRETRGRRPGSRSVRR